jgi:hypothetical protein
MAIHFLLLIGLAPLAISALQRTLRVLVHSDWEAVPIAGNALPIAILLRGGRLRLGEDCVDDCVKNPQRRNGDDKYPAAKANLGFKWQLGITLHSSAP